MTTKTTTKGRIPTFRTDAKLLTGAEANEAWGNQRVRCGCGSYGTTDDSISGSAGDKPAVWLGCPNCSGSALGLPLVYCLPSQVR